MSLNIIIGRAPPSSGVLPLGRPLIDRPEAGWDIMREILWCSSLTTAELVQGADRAAASGITGSPLFKGQSFRHLGTKAGRPVVELLSKGFFNSKTSKWTYNHALAGDVMSGFANGPAYAVEQYLPNSRPNGNETVRRIPNEVFGWGSGGWGGSGDTTGWLRARREFDVLVGNNQNVVMVTDTYVFDTLLTI